MLNSSEDEYSKFATRKWYVIDSKKTGGYSRHEPKKSITESIESSPSDYSDACILVKGSIVVTRTIAADANANPPVEKE